MQVLHIMEAFQSKRMFRPAFATSAFAYIMQKLRAGQHTVLDVAHTAHVIGEWRAGFRRAYTEPLHPILQELVAVIEMRSAEYLKVNQFNARQIATVMWMFGRLTFPPESTELRNLLSVYICEHVRPPLLCHCCCCALHARVVCEAGGHQCMPILPWLAELHARACLMAHGRLCQASNSDFVCTGI